MDPGQGLCRLLAEIAEKTPVQRPFRKTVEELTALDLAYAPPFPFRDWFMAKVREHTVLREEQAALAAFAVVPDLDMAGARGAALAAHVSHQSTSINLIHQ